MDELFNQMMKSCNELVITAKSIMNSGRKKKAERKSNPKLIISAFLNRSVEIFESFLILQGKNKMADSANLLRSLCELGINTSYIYSDSKMREINALRYLINEEKEKIKLIGKNLEEFKIAKRDIDKRRKELEEQNKEMIDAFKKAYQTNDLNWPSIRDRADKSNDHTVKKMYNQIYSYLCSIEHHDMSFLRNYIDEKTDEPLKLIITPPLLRPELNMIVARSILLVIVKTFNDEYCLEWASDLKIHEDRIGKEYEKMKNKDKQALSKVAS